MDERGMDAPARRALGAANATAPESRRHRRRLAIDLTLLALVGVLLLAALGAGGVALYRALYSPTAFVTGYLDLLAAGNAADALSVPGVAVDSIQLEDAGLPATSSAALLRSAALVPLTDVRAVSETDDGRVTRVTVEYSAGGYPGSTRFDIERAGWIGVVPGWRFARSPLSVMDLDVTGSMAFTVNGFDVDKRQVSPDGVRADPVAPVALLVFSPGAYTVTVDTALASTSGVAVLADAPLASVAVRIRADPTEQFVAVVQEKVTDFLTACAAQSVLQPTGCPFGIVVQDRVENPPVWTIANPPTLRLEPDGAGWRIPPTPGVAHISVDIRSLFDGTLRRDEQDVEFAISGTISIQPDGSASIAVNGAEN